MDSFQPFEGQRFKNWSFDRVYPGIFTLLIAIIISEGIWSFAMAENGTDNDVRFESVEVLSKTKSQAESRVKFVNSLLEDGEISKKDLRHIRNLYEEARADVNAGMDKLLVEIESTGSQGSIDPYKEIAERASKQVAEFLEASDELILGEDRSGMAVAGLEIVDSMIQAFVDVWKTLRGEKTERRSLLIQRIESLKWSQFEEIQ